MYREARTSRSGSNLNEEVFEKAVAASGVEAFVELTLLVLAVLVPAMTASQP